MKYSFGVAALAAVAAASPLNTIVKRQGIDFDAYDAIPKLPPVSAPVGIVAHDNESTYDQAAAVDAAVDSIVSSSATGADAAVVRRSIEARAVCAAQRASNVASQYTLTGASDTAGSFKNATVFSAVANDATLAPKGFTAVPGFTNLNAAASDASYMTYISDGLTKWDPNYCAAVCQANSGCVAFNMFFERDPSLAPDDTACPSPASVTYLKCSLFKAPITAAMATNKGQWRSKFQVVIAGSNAYNIAVPANPAGFQPGLNLNGKTIEASGYMGVQTFPQGTAYDPSICATACQTKSQFDIDHDLPSADKPDICKFFSAYIQYRNGINGVFTCTYYNAYHTVAEATNAGQTRGSDKYTMGMTWGWNIEEGTWPTTKST